MGELSSDNDEAEDHSLRPNNFENTSIEIGAILHGIVVSHKISQLVVWQGQKLTSHACIPWVFQTFLMQSSCPSRFWDRVYWAILGTKKSQRMPAHQEALESEKRLREHSQESLRECKEAGP